MWKQVPRNLAELSGCGVLAYSRYGNGFSQPLAEARPVTYMHDEADALTEVLDAFEIGSAVLVGHSDGASIALIYAGENGARVSGIVAEAPHTFVEDLSVRGIAQAKKDYEAGALRERLRRYHADPDRTFYGWNDIWLSQPFRAWNIGASVRKITAPVLLIQGMNDEYGSRAQLEAVRSDAQRARVDALHLAACGHAPHRDRADLVLPAIAAFARSVAARVSDEP